MKRIITSIGVLLFIASITVAIISYGRGYRFDVKDGKINPTGILSASSYPEKASIWVDGKLISTTNNALSLAPNWYRVKISKEGYQGWEKDIQIRGEIVSQIDALLIPMNPSLRTLTVTGVATPSVSPSGTRVAFIIPPSEEPQPIGTNPKTGVWLTELRTGPLGGKNEPRPIYQPKTSIDWENVEIKWSPDERYLLISLFARDTKTTKNTLIRAVQSSVETSNSEPIDVTASYKSLLTTWEKETREKEKLALEALPLTIGNTLASKAAEIRFSPDETKILYTATSSADLSRIINPPLIGTNSTKEERQLKTGYIYVYDRKEDRNYFLLDRKDIQSPETMIWYADSKHIAMIEKDTLYIIDFDGTNKRGVYAGPFEKSVLYAWPSGGKLVILTNLNNPNANTNLYLLDLT